MPRNARKAWRDPSRRSPARSSDATARVERWDAEREVAASLAIVLLAGPLARDRGQEDSQLAGVYPVARAGRGDHLAGPGRRPGRPRDRADRGGAVDRGTCGRAAGELARAQC